MGKHRATKTGQHVYLPVKGGPPEKRKNQTTATVKPKMGRWSEKSEKRDPIKGPKAQEVQGLRPMDKQRLQGDPINEGKTRESQNG